jgi:hypothetical protein
MFLLFLLCCAVQYNDPDPLTWIAVYGYAAALTGFAFFGKYTALPALGMVAYLPWFFLLAPPLNVSWWALEEGREAMGLMICAVWMSVLLFLWYRKRSKAVKNSA